MSAYISYVYAIRRRWSCLLTHMWRFQKKNITRQKHHKNCKHQTTWIHCANWLTHAHSLFSAQIGGFEFDIPHWLWDGWHDPRNYTWLHFQGLVCIDLTIPYDSPKGVFCFRGGWVGETKQSCATCATIARFPPTLLTRDVKQKMSIHHLRLTCIVSLVNRYYTDMSHWHLSISLVYLFPFVQHIFFFEKHPQKLRAHAKHKRTHAFHIQTRKEQRELLLQSALLET